jgi:hypothetical protein
VEGKVQLAPEDIEQLLNQRPSRFVLRLADEGKLQKAKRDSLVPGEHRELQ